MPLLRVIVDTNVLVSGIIGAPSNPPGMIIAAMIEGAFAAATSEALLEEYLATLMKPRLVRLHELDGAAVHTYVGRLRSMGVIHAPARSPLDCPDPHDQHLWDLLSTVPDALLVTGETKLLQSRHFPGRILSPRDFAERYLV